MLFLVSDQYDISASPSAHPIAQALGGWRNNQMDGMYIVEEFRQKPHSSLSTLKTLSEPFKTLSEPFQALSKPLKAQSGPKRLHQSLLRPQVSLARPNLSLKMSIPEPGMYKD